MPMELITLVNDNDKIIGYGEKLKVHESGKLHRAFSVFIYDETCNRMLLQKRAVNLNYS